MHTPANRRPQSPKALEKAEEQWGDLDGDGEKGEAPAHQRKVRKATAMAKKNGTMPPAFLKGKGSKPVMPPVAQKKSSGSAGNMCPACIKGKKTSCSHM